MTYARAVLALELDLSALSAKTLRQEREVLGLQSVDTYLPCQGHPCEFGGMCACAMELQVPPLDPGNAP